jgi:hypothetical protein
MFPAYTIVSGIFLCVAVAFAVGASLQAARGNTIARRAYIRIAVMFVAVAVVLLVRYGIK